jgi:hypothetical protein
VQVVFQANQVEILIEDGHWLEHLHVFVVLRELMAHGEDPAYRDFQRTFFVFFACANGLSRSTTPPIMFGVFVDILS